MDTDIIKLLYLKDPIINFNDLNHFLPLPPAYLQSGALVQPRYFAGKESMVYREWHLSTVTQMSSDRVSVQSWIFGALCIK